MERVRIISSEPNILVVDREYLVAMEAERVLLDTFACRMRIAMPHEFSHAMEHDRFDLLIVDTSVADDDGSRILANARAGGTKLIFTTLTKDAMRSLPQFQGFATVAKPFSDEDLIDAVKAALSVPEPEPEPEA
ncbi:MAG TPA: hypothetical protein VGO22_00065 [Pseudorhizobium sp.]|nr:hypothetical protein [Pseudorhizobium sp.]